MARLKVVRDKRKRVSQACNACRKRKQKCDGFKPCKVCRKRRVDCEYRSNTASESSGESTAQGSPSKQSPSERSPVTPDQGGLMNTIESPTDINREQKSISPEFNSKFCLIPVPGSEEIKVHTYSCLLLDYYKQRSFVGHSATQSFVALIRDTVRDKSGSSDFTDNNDWSRLPETPAIHPNSLRPLELPSLDVARTLTESYFTNTQGFIKAVDRQSVESTLIRIYNSSNQAQGPDRCLLYLVLAIGLALGPHSLESYPVYSRDLQLKDQLFVQAKSLADSWHGYGGSESDENNLWFLQALVLMSFYMLADSKRNAAYDYCGRAVRTAYMLGLHRGHEIDAYTAEDLWAPRRNLWRSLFIIDRFLAASLGRPLAISERDYEESSLKLPKQASGRYPQWDILESAVHACQMIGHALNHIYSQRKVSIEVPNQMIKYLEDHPVFKSDDFFDSVINSVPKMAQVHVQLFGFYANILVCRPFFLLRFMYTTECEAVGAIEAQINKLSERCVSQSLRAIMIVKKGFSANLFPRFDSLALHLLFEAAVVLLSSTYADIYSGGEHSQLVTDAIDILRQWSHSSLYAEHFASMLDLFRSDVEREVQGKAIKLTSRKPARRIKAAPITTSDPSQYRSPFYTTPHGSLVSPCDSRRGSTATTNTVIKQEGGGFLDSLATRPLVSPMHNNTPRSQILTEYSKSSPGSDHSYDSNVDRKQPRG